MSDYRDLVILYDEDGNETEFEVVTTIEVNDNMYAVLLPTLQQEGENEACILRVEEDDCGEEVLMGIDDEEELAEVILAYESLLDEEDN